MKKVSVIIPAYNCANTICATLDSLKIQTYKNFEAIIVNDGSTDETEKIIEEYKLKESFSLKYYRQHNAGVSAARNFGNDRYGELVLMNEKQGFRIWCY